MHGTKITGVFQPKRLDTLRPEFAPLIGRRVSFTYGWLMEEGDQHPGQIAWVIDRDQPGVPEELGGLWCPAEDIAAA